MVLSDQNINKYKYLRDFFTYFYDWHWYLGLSFNCFDSFLKLLFSPLFSFSDENYNFFI